MNRHDAILAGVWRVIIERGVAGVSMRTVAEAAGVSVGLVQHYHRSKDALVRASAAAMIAGADARYRESHADPEGAVRHLITHAIPTSGPTRDGVVIWHAYLAASVADDELAALLRAAKAGQERELALLVGAMAPALDAEVVARTLVAVADGLSARVVLGDLEGDEAVATAMAALSALTGASRPAP